MNAESFIFDITIELFKFVLMAIPDCRAEDSGEG